MSNQLTELSEFATMIRYASDPAKLRTIKKWLNLFFDRSEFWSESQSSENSEIAKRKNDLIDALDYLIETSIGSDIKADKNHAITIFTKAAHYEIAKTSGLFNEPNEIQEFESVLDWTISHGWVISQIDPSSAQKISPNELPKWLIDHYSEVISAKE